MILKHFINLGSGKHNKRENKLKNLMLEYDQKHMGMLYPWILARFSVHKCSIFANFTGK